MSEKKKVTVYQTISRSSVTWLRKREKQYLCLYFCSQIPDVYLFIIFVEYGVQLDY